MSCMLLMFATPCFPTLCGVRSGINANICLRLAGAPAGVKVYLGDGKPVAEIEITEASHAGVDVHGPDALGEARPATVESDLQFGALSAKDFLYQRCAALPGQVTLVALGPLTNVAACLRDHPDLPRLVKRIVIMGGAVLEQRGNRTPSSEANFADDPTAAHEVLTAGFADLVLAPLDVTHQIDLVALRTSLGESKGELAGFLHDISRFYIAAYFKLGHAHVPVHDPVSSPSANGTRGFLRSVCTSQRACRAASARAAGCVLTPDCSTRAAGSHCIPAAADAVQVAGRAGRRGDGRTHHLWHVGCRLEWKDTTRCQRTGFARCG